jgi:integrase
MSRIRLRFVQQWADHEGRVHRYFRRPGYPRVRLPGLPGSGEFMQAYQDALSSRPEPIGAARTKPGSLDAALVSYYEARAFKGLAEGTRGMRRAILERWRSKNGAKPIAQLPPEYIAHMLAKMAPHQARNTLKTIRHFSQYCIAHKFMRNDPTLGIKAKVPKSDGIHCWSADEIARFEAHHAVGSKARLAFALGLYTAQRRGDVVKIGRQHIRDGVLTLRQGKTGAALSIPIHPELQAILDATSAIGQLTLLVTRKGRPYGPNDFSEQFRKWCDDADLPPECSFHGLRKAACTRLAEAGCTEHEIAAISGHKSMRLVEHYTRAVDQAKLARAAMERIGKKTVKPEPAEVSKPLRQHKKNAT